MAKIISLESFRARPVSHQPPPYQQTLILRQSAKSEKIENIEVRASRLMTAAANLLLESTPENVRIAWMLQDLRDLIVRNENQDEKPLPVRSSDLTNLG